MRRGWREARNLAGAWQHEGLDRAFPVTCKRVSDAKGVMGGGGRGERGGKEGRMVGGLAFKPSASVYRLWAHIRVCEVISWRQNILSKLGFEARSILCLVSCS